MKRVIVILLFAVFSDFCMAQVLNFHVSTLRSYYDFTHNSIYQSKLLLENTSNDTLIMWVTYWEVDSNDMHNINEYFWEHIFGNTGSLGQIIYDYFPDMNVGLGESFITEIVPKQSFSILLLDTVAIQESEVLSFAKRHVVAMPKSLLDKWNFFVLPTWKMLLYKENELVLKYDAIKWCLRR